MPTAPKLMFSELEIDPKPKKVRLSERHEADYQFLSRSLSVYYPFLSRTSPNNISFNLQMIPELHTCEK